MGIPFGIDLGRIHRCYGLFWLDHKIEHLYGHSIYMTFNDL